MKVVYEALTLPTGQTMTVRPTLKPPHKGAKAAQGAADAAAGAATLFITAGVPLLLLFEKGDEQVVPEGTIEVVYLNGPLSMSRKALQSLSFDHGYIYVSEGVTNRRKDLSAPVLNCGERLVAGTFGTFGLEMLPGTYWFSTDSPKEHPVRVEVLPGHEYFLWRTKDGLFAKEFEPKKGRGYPSRIEDVDLTKLTPEEYRSLTAEPADKGNY